MKKLKLNLDELKVESFETKNTLIGKIIGNRPTWPGQETCHQMCATFEVDYCTLFDCQTWADDLCGKKTANCD